jgi:hypothetical protein
MVPLAADQIGIALNISAGFFIEHIGITFQDCQSRGNLSV